MRRFLVALSCLLGLVALSGCGRKATRSDCEHFFDKNVEVKMKEEGVTDAPSIQKRQAELKAQPDVRDDIDQCVGRRITDGMLKCVDTAQKDSDVDKCLR